MNSSNLIQLPARQANITERIFLGKMLTLFRKPERLSTREYAEKYRWLSSEVTAKPGRMDCMETPFMLFPMECMDNVEIKVIVGRKSAQIAWSETTNSYLAKRMHLDPQNIIIAFPRMESAKKYSREKIKPLIKSNSYLLETIGNPDRCSYKFFKFHGGWLSLVTARSTEDLKSSSVPIIIVEEPDGLQEDVGNQGDALDLLMQRQKTFEERKLIYAGTPTDEDFSRVDTAYKQSNQMIYLIPCRRCGELQRFDFKQLVCDPYPNRKLHEIYGKWDPKTARYECVYCNGTWDDADRKWSVIEALNYNELGWIALRPDEKDIYGFAFNELMSSFSASTHYELMKKKIKAERALEKGEEGLMKSFVNNSEGRAYSSKLTGLEVEELQRKRLSYEEGFAPIGVLGITMGIDVQHNRFAIVIRGWGRNNCSWGILWTEIFGDVKNPEDPVWERLTQFVTTPITSVQTRADDSVVKIPISAVSIDSSDGTTTELVYSWAKAMNDAGYTVFAIKGSSDTDFNAEIYSEPALPDDPDGKALRNTLASRYGVNVFIMGTHRAHEEIIRRYSLEGTRDRYYHCEYSYPDYEEQILSCIKRVVVGKTIVAYSLKPGRRKEAIDCEKMALHASYPLGYRMFKEEHWEYIEDQLFNLTPGER